MGRGTRTAGQESGVAVAATLLLPSPSGGEAGEPKPRRAPGHPDGARQPGSWAGRAGEKLLRAAAGPGSGRLRLWEFVLRLQGERGQHRGRREAGGDVGGPGRAGSRGAEPRRGVPRGQPPFPRASLLPCPGSLTASKTCPQAQMALTQAGMRSPLEKAGAAALCPGTGISAAPDLSEDPRFLPPTPLLPFPLLLLLSSSSSRSSPFLPAPPAERPRAQPPDAAAGPGGARRGRGREWPGISRQGNGVWGWQPVCACVRFWGREARGPGGAGGGTMGRGRYKKGCGQGRGVMERGGVGPRGRR